jgi:hypothetical protein
MAVRTEMLNILRNIACNEAVDIDLVVKGIGEARLFSLIEDSLHTTRQEMLLHGLYLVSNIATGTEAHRSAIMNRIGIIRALLEQLVSPLNRTTFRATLNGLISVYLTVEQSFFGC